MKITLTKTEAISLIQEALHNRSLSNLMEIKIDSEPLSTGAVWAQIEPIFKLAFQVRAKEIKLPLIQFHHKITNSGIAESKQYIEKLFNIPPYEQKI